MNERVMPQPPPKPGEARPTWELVVEKCRENAQTEHEAEAEVWRLLAEDGQARDAFGAAKYGVRHQHDNGRDHAVDAYQEALDGAMYWEAEARETGNYLPKLMAEAALEFAYKCRAYLLRRYGE